FRLTSRCARGAPNTAGTHPIRKRQMLWCGHRERARAPPARDKARSRVRANAPRREPLQDAAKRASLKMAAGAFAGLILPLSVGAKETQPTFDQWIAAFQSKAL